MFIQKVLKENIELVKLIAKYLLEVETLTREHIYEIVDTGTLSWWENKKAKDASIKAETKEIEAVEETPKEEVSNEAKKAKENKS